MICLRRNVLLIGIVAGMFVMPGCAAINESSYEGYLQSGEDHSGHLHSSDLWLLSGEKGCRVVIADIVDPGDHPPEIYLFAPGCIECEAHSHVVSARCQVLDHTFESTGEYTLVVHRQGQDHEGGYRISCAKLPEEGCYSIDPEYPDGHLICSDCILPEECIEVWKAASLTGIPVITPYLTSNITLMIHSGLGTIGRILDFRGRKRAKILSTFDHVQETDPKAAVR
ncbi:MAG TPA: hypothetical protein PLU81_00010 [Deltaproteobacteria bacterium]|nr:hypothetical protein [Deltaproteobacteria bacterium]